MAFNNLQPACGAVRAFLALIAIAAGGLVLASPAAAETTRETFGIGVTVTECGNTINLSGTAVLTRHVTETPSGGFLVTGHFLFREMRGSDEFGHRYVANGLEQRSLDIITPAGGSISTFMTRLHIVGMSGAPTFHLNELIHVTVTPAGEVTAEVAKFSVECV
jgi:hypothetical protein